MEIYRLDVIAVGEGADELIEAGMFITFSSTAPPELAHYSVLVDPGEFRTPLQSGDLFTIDGKRFPILALGNVVNKNLKELAHAVWMFDGKEQVKMPGEVHLVKSNLPTIEIGTQLIIERPGIN